MIHRPVRLLVLVLVVLLGMAANVEAADPGCGGERVAKAQFELGQAHHKLGNYLQAMADFEAGYACVPLPLFLYDIAQMARLSGQRGKALEFYRRYLAAEPNARERVYVQRWIAVLSRAHATSPSSDVPPAPGTRAPPLLAPTAPPPVAVVAPPPPAVAPPPPVVAPVLVVTPPPPEKPSHKGRWIALGIIGGVLVVGGAVTAGVLLGTKSSSGVPSNFHNLGSF